MFKELILAILLGAVLGFGITGSVIGIKNRQNTSTTVPTPTATISTVPTSTNSLSPAPSPASNQLLTIDTPQDESVSATAKIELQGTSSPESLIVAQAPLGVYTTTASNEGKFKLPIELQAGLNLIHVTSIDADDNQVNLTISVTYSTAKF